MDGASEDTETLIALVSSLLTVPAPKSDVLLDVIVRNNGNVQAAADFFNHGHEAGGVPKNVQSKKRKRPLGLDDWLSNSSPNASAIPSGSKRDDSNGEPPQHPVPLKAITHSSSSSSPAKPVVDLMSVLRQAPPVVQTTPRLPPLMLSNPSMVAQHTPCTMHLSILPPDLACRLFYTMVDLSRTWNRNKWWLFDRVVESPHRTCFYARRTDGVDTDEGWQEAAQYWYNGRPGDPPQVFPEPMEEACEIVERIVNDEMRKRSRLPLEWAGKGTEGQIWRANVAASNCYEGTKESVGFHSDHLTYLGPYPTIASLSLGTTRIFRLREVIPSDQISTRRARTFNIPLAHNSLTIMHAATQETFKHAIPPQPTLDPYKPLYPHPLDPSSSPEPSNCRINITFRFYRPDFHPKSIPRCKCNVPTILRPDMKNRQDGKADKYWWTCYAGAQNEGKGCGFWRVMDVTTEGRGPTIADLEGKA
ncbi:hypothetical protein BV22DRAFT_1029177 [Leucogyrophana mollusca]|uniref:Uncharacterized protein n=1 Tax=Leucogyrophana mollusca TaxID=85980 RepID=A0ACB8BWC7_9AGAM|nr:hypothetical protein BV22DRAFT_1029177 [Leucogyrophana mollusca]